MKILKIVGIALAVIVVLVFVGISMMSPQAKMERSIVVNAPPETVFAQLASFENFNQWSMWFFGLYAVELGKVKQGWDRNEYKPKNK